MEPSESKDALRARMRSIRNAIPEAERRAIDERICANVCSMPEFAEAEVVLSYLSMGAEIDTHGIIKAAWQAGKAVALPRCVGPRAMRWFRVTSFEGLEKSSFGVEEPPIDELAEQMPSADGKMVAIVPGYAFDDAGFRLGYGGGFYDTFLAEFKGASIGLCRDAQRVESLGELGAIGPYDLPVHLVVTECGLLRARP